MPKGLRALRRPWVFLPVLQLLQWVGVLVWAHKHTNQSTAFVWLAVLVGLPVALISMYRLGSLVGGRRLGAFAAALWVVVPFAMQRLFDPRYRYQYSNQIVPRALGLTESGEFVVMVLLLAACVWTAIALRRGTPRAWLAGLVTGVAGMVDAAGLLYVPAALLAFLAVRRPRQIVAFGLGLVPGIVVVLARGTGRAVEFGSWHEIHHNFIFVREFFYSLRVLEWLPIAGCLAVCRRSIPIALLVGAWFTAFLLIQGSSSDVNDYSFWRVLLPAFPAYVLLTAAIPLLVPAPRAFREIVLPSRFRPRRVP